MEEPAKVFVADLTRHFEKIGKHDVSWSESEVVGTYRDETAAWAAYIVYFIYNRQFNLWLETNYKHDAPWLAELHAWSDAWSKEHDDVEPNREFFQSAVGCAKLWKVNRAVTAWAIADATPLEAVRDLVSSMSYAYDKDLDSKTFIDVFPQDARPPLTGADVFDCVTSAYEASLADREITAQHEAAMLAADGKADVVEADVEAEGAGTAAASPPTKARRIG